jgi:hypothetical protein
VRVALYPATRSKIVRQGWPATAAGLPPAYAFCSLEHANSLTLLTCLRQAGNTISVVLSVETLVNANQTRRCHNPQYQNKHHIAVSDT